MMEAVLTPAGEPIRVVILVLPGPDAGDVFGPLDILRYASHFAMEQGASPRPTGYAIEVVSASDEAVLWDTSGLRLTAEQSYRDVSGPIDTLLVMPIDESLLPIHHPPLTRWVAAIADGARRVVGLCTGAFLLARAGLLDGRQATTHWAFCEQLQRHFPAVHVESDPIYLRDGRFYTSAGAMAGMDLVLALVEEDFGPQVARAVARYLVLFLRRPGGQSQFSAQLAAQFAQRPPLRELQGWIVDHLDADLSVDALAQRAAMSPRNFRRVFTREVGQTPAKFVERVRVEAAQRYLEDTADGIQSIAATCGFASAEHLRCAFVRALGIGPAAYRQRFATSCRPASREVLA